MLDQAGVDNGFFPDFFFEHDPGLVFLNDNALDQLTTDVQSIAADGSAMGQRKYQFTFKDSVMGVAEDHGHRRLGKQSANDNVHVERINQHRDQLSGICDHQRRGTKTLIL